MPMVITDLVDENINIDEDVLEVLEAIETPEKFLYNDDLDEFFGNFTNEVKRKRYDEEAHSVAGEVNNQCNLLSALDSLKYKKSVEVHLTKESRLSEFIIKKNISLLKQKAKQNRKVYSLEEVDSILNDINRSC